LLCKKMFQASTVNLDTGLAEARPGKRVACRARAEVKEDLRPRVSTLTYPSETSYSDSTWVPDGS
jgi:hypothetical protein